MTLGQDRVSISTRPYLVRAIYDWCCDNGFTPHIRVAVDNSVQVPLEYVREGVIVLNLSMEATTGLRLDNDYISFKARFSGVAKEVIVPLERVTAIFARENDQGMVFPAINRTAPNDQPEPPAPPKPPTTPKPPESPKPSTRPALKRIK